ncbi:hypothetical protein [Filimonas effusa]|uniref:hypothetical protein n=1 Tax=Filimonas effusa TaxID=2508721 RepID=UPI001FE964CD|nr:hypothetical protein [Filimonas effusa]
MAKNFPRNIGFGLSLSLPFNIAKGWPAENNPLLYHDYSDLNEQQIRLCFSANIPFLPMDESDGHRSLG